MNNDSSASLSSSRRLRCTFYGGGGGTNMEKTAQVSEIALQLPLGRRFREGGRLVRLQPSTPLDRRFPHVGQA